MSNLKKNIVVLFDPPPPYGGVRVSSSVMFCNLQREKSATYESIPFDSSDLSLPLALIQFWKKVRISDVVLFQIGDVRTLTRRRGILYWITAKLAGVPIFYRGFAGGLMHHYERNPLWKQWLLNTMLTSCRAVTFQTQQDCRFFEQLLKGAPTKVYWFPNSRNIQPYTLPSRSKAKRFCFIGKVCRLKGAHLLVEVAPQLPPDVSIDLFGPVTTQDAEDIGIQTLSADSQVRYCGTIEPKRVTKMLQNYDALLLPTTWKTEGHPGVILEAFSVGLPVIATRWNGIPELIDESCGILIEPNSVDKLVEAITAMHNDPVRWQGMRVATLDRIKQFDLALWSHRLHEWVMNTVQ